MADHTSTTTSTAGPDRAAVRSRKAFARRQWRRRWLRWRYVVAAVLLVAAVVGGTWLVAFSSVLAVQHVQVTGTQLLSREDVLDRAQVPDGEPLARLDLGAVAARVRAMAPVRSVEVTREWPHDVRIDVTEREALAVVEIGGQLRGLDSDGVVFRDYRQAPPGLPLLEVQADTSQDALKEGADVVSALPADLAAKVDHLAVATVDQITLVLHNGRTVQWGSAEQSELKARVLTELLRQPGRTFDVSAPGQPTVRR